VIDDDVTSILFPVEAG